MQGGGARTSPPSWGWSAVGRVLGVLYEGGHVLGVMSWGGRVLGCHVLGAVYWWSRTGPQYMTPTAAMHVLVGLMYWEAVHWGVWLPSTMDPVALGSARAIPPLCHPPPGATVLNARHPPKLHPLHRRVLPEDEVRAWAARIQELAPRLCGPLFFLWGTDWEDAPILNARWAALLAAGV